MPVHPRRFPPATTTPLSARARARAEHAAARQIGEQPRDTGALVPDIRMTTIRDHNGAVLRAPTAAPASWRDPDDLNPRARSARMVRGWKRSTALDRLFRVSQSRGGLINREHMEATDRYRGDCEKAVADRAAWLELSGVRTAPGPRDGGNPQMRAALVRFRAARAAIGEAGCAVLDGVVLLNVDVKAYAATHELDERIVMGLLVAALTRLVEHYGRRTLRRSVFEE